MKSIKILALALLVAFVMPSCDNNKESGKENNKSGLAKDIVKEWRITTWNGEAQPFDVYVDFNEDGSFEMFQRLESLNYVRYAGTYNVQDDILTGSYEDGTIWKCGYKGEVSSDGMTLTLHSQEDISITTVYASTVIPEEVKAEAAETRVESNVRFF